MEKMTQKKKWIQDTRVRQPSCQTPIRNPGKPTGGYGGAIRMPRVAVYNLQGSKEYAKGNKAKTMPREQV